MNYLERRQEQIELVLTGLLPHGSGIDCKWEFSWQKNGSIVCSNSYHVMNDIGYYVGYCDFKVIIPQYVSCKQFRLEICGKHSSLLNKKYLIKDYLEDTIYLALPDDQDLLDLALNS